MILCIKITISEQRISLDQSTCVEKILKKYTYFDYKLASTPYDQSVKLFKNTGESVRQTEYANIIGSLRYVTDCAKPDIAYVVGLLRRFTSKPSNEHWKAIEWVMQYFKKTVNLNLHYQRFIVVLEGYNNATWVLFIDSHMWLWNLGQFLWNCEAEFLEPSLNRDTRVGSLKHILLEYTLKKCCVGVWCLR